MRIATLRAVVLCVLSQALLGANTGEDFPLVINGIIRIAFEKNAEKGLVLLEQIQGFDAWSFGGGVGPSDRTTLMTIALTSFEGFLPWKDSASSSIGTNSASQIQHWMRADPKSAAAMAAMLTSADPVARWMACEKMKREGTVPPEVMPALGRMVLEDERLLIVKQALEHVFDAPLRREARELLRLAGEEPVPLDQRKLSREGLAWLGRLYIDRVNDRIARFSIESALRQLAPKTPEIIAAQSRAQINQSAEYFLTLFQGLKNDGASVLRDKSANSRVQIEAARVEARGQRPKTGGAVPQPAQQAAVESGAAGISPTSVAGAILILVMLVGAVYALARK